MNGRFLAPAEPRPVFTAFGQWTLAPIPAWPVGDITVDADHARTRAAIRRTAPSAPGVYGMVDAYGELIYVGQSKSLRNRLVSYFSTAAPHKARRIVAHTSRLVWEAGPDPFAALLRELELICRWRPRFNVQGQPSRLRPTYLVLGRGPARHVYLSAAAQRGDTAVFGPLRASRRWRRAVRVLNDCFQLRTCGQQVPVQFADQRDLFPEDRLAKCLRHDLGKCVAPCAASCSSGEYREKVRSARRFLAGKELSVLDRLQQEMQQAAAARRYEQAALLRDSREVLESLHEHLQRLRDARRHYTFIYPVDRHDGGQTWYVIRQGQVLAAVGGPDGEAVDRQRLSLVHGDGHDASSARKALSEDMQVLLLVAAWFRRHPEELGRVMLPGSSATS